MKHEKMKHKMCMKMCTHCKKNSRVGHSAHMCPKCGHKTLK